MEHARFWSLIDEARGNPDRLVDALARLTESEIASFDAWFWAYYMATHRSDLWAAVYAICGGCSDDGFDYFRGWLIGRGEAVVLQAIRDPEALLDLIEGDPSNELMLGAARTAYERVTGREELPESAPVEIPRRAEWPPDRVAPGTRWNHAFYARTFPRLAHLVAEEPTGQITHERFWAIVEQRIARDALPEPERIGYDRWAQAYNEALMRNDLRAACRVLLGDDSLEMAFGLRGWLIAQGRAVVETAVHDLDSLLEVAREAPRRYPLEFSRVHRDDVEPIPGRDTWAPDWTEQPPFAVALLRERLPRLAANRSDDELVGSVNPATLSAYERERRAGELLERAQSYTSSGHADAALPMLDDAARLLPGRLEIYAARGRTHLALGNVDAALADFDRAIALEIDPSAARWDRAQLREARGDRAGALDDARRAADRIPAAKAWVSAIERAIPRRVRHATFGDGTVVSAADGKLVIDFPSGRKTLAARFVEVLE